MFAELVDDFMQWDSAALDAEFRRFEVESRQREARRLALLQAVEAKQVGRADGFFSTRAYMKAVTHTSGAHANAAVKRARTCRAAPEIGEALAAGHIGVAQVDELARIHSNPRVRVMLPAAAPKLLDHAEHFAHADFKRIVDRFLVLADLDGAWNDHLSSVEGRSASVDIVGDEVNVAASGGDKLLGEQLKAVFRRYLDREVERDMRARREQYGDQAQAFPLARSHRQRAFDALVAIFAAADKAADAGLEGKLPNVVVNVLFDQKSLAQFLQRAGLVLPDGKMLDVSQLDDAQLDDLLAGLSDDPTDLLDRHCETESGQAIHPVLLLRAALTEHIRRVVVNTAGTVIDYGRLTRLYTGSARSAALLTVPNCEHPGCELGGGARQVDHNIEWGDEGRTDQANRTVLHGAHNRFKHEARWRSRRAANGRAYWVRPDGSLVLAAGERPPDFADAELEEGTRRRLDALAAMRAA